MPGRFICDRCGNTIPPHAHYVVKITVYADPTIPAVSSDDLEETDYATRMSDLMQQMSKMTAEQLQDSVHWHRDFKICRDCQLHLTHNPLGAPDLQA